ncbi:LacI family DNA-binding transcriptional regulator [Agromyces archimandritae]|uniref:LacI family DNA-binding transcriptional regulator n=1 Tax=Agromyces archimandritae TaxID=2781962 RepID=UPI001FD4396B|nr:LacI family DNA-binding transcriptional regulator [Agromyces archimandritae]
MSRATVSRVVNGSPKVKPAAAEAVHAAIAELGYVPNRAARSLASRRTQAIALVVPESVARVFADPFFASIVQGVALALAPTDYTLTMLIESEQDPGKTRRYLAGGNVDGAIVVSHHTGDHSFAELNRSLPVVFGGRPLDASAESGYSVDVDNVGAAADAARHLIARGRRHLATIAGPQDMPPGVDRLAGFRAGAGAASGAGASAAAGAEDAGASASAGAAGMSGAAVLVEYGDFSPASGAAAMRRLLERGEPIDAVFTANDQMALGACTAIRDAGLTVPGDIAVVGFDDDLSAATASPPLTTVHQPSVEMGAEMARILVRLIEGEEVPRLTLLPTRLVVRASS